MEVDQLEQNSLGPKMPGLRCAPEDHGVQHMNWRIIGCICHGLVRSLIHHGLVPLRGELGNQFSGFEWNGLSGLS